MGESLQTQTYSMRSVTICLLLGLLVSCHSAKQQLEGDLEELIEEVEEVGGLELVGNLGSVDTDQTDPLSTLKRSLVQSGDYGVVIDVQNYSGLKLTDPTLYLNYGQGRRFGEVREPRHCGLLQEHPRQ